MSEYAPQRVIKALKDVNSMPDIFRVKTPSLAAMRRDCGEQFVIDYLAMWLITLDDMLNITNKMSETQIEYTCSKILAENPLLTVADIKVVFDSALTGKYGKLFNRLDPPIICTWFRDHWSERLNAAAEISIRESEEYKKGNFERSTNSEIQAFREAHRTYYQQKMSKTDGNNNEND